MRSDESSTESTSSMSDIEHAREARARKAELLRDLSTGRMSLPEALRANPRALRRTILWDILRAARGMGPVGCRIACEDANLNPMITREHFNSSDIERLIQNLPKRAQS